jgi:hypothetical protein
VAKLGEMRSRQLLERDRDALSSLLHATEADFARAWKARKRSLTGHAKFCLFASILGKLTDDLRDSAKTSPAYLGATLADLERRKASCKREGKAVCQEAPARAAEVVTGLNLL